MREIDFEREVIASNNTLLKPRVRQAAMRELRRNHEEEFSTIYRRLQDEYGVITLVRKPTVSERIMQRFTVVK